MLPLSPHFFLITPTVGQEADIAELVFLSALEFMPRSMHPTAEDRKTAHDKVIETTRRLSQQGRRKSSKIYGSCQV